MPVDSIPALIVALRDSGSLRAVHLEELAGSLQNQFQEPRRLAKELIQRGWLTPFQINQVFRGRGRDLAIGPFVLLERLGEGGMGQVFKAWHRSWDRIVALKIIRKDRLDSPETVRRFEREIEAASRLSHPNIVAAYDSGTVAGTRYVALEYVEGWDLSRLLKSSGPLPVAIACDYMGQAALGLQHAFERGLVHRDIKPSNLLVARSSRNKDSAAELGTLKILDMGLARLSNSEEPADTITNFQATLGTPDYIAPEQARDAHAADIRSDLYSLGCTFYHLVTGRVPFPGGAAMEKLLKHWMEEATPIEELRPEVSVELGDIIRKLMAKKPQDRCQEPIELVAALARVTEAKAPAGGVRLRRPKTDLVDRPGRVPTPLQDTIFPSSMSDTDEGPILHVNDPGSTRRNQELIQIAISGVAVLVLCVLIVLLLIFR
jgi:serine/threonine-protein kinase